MKIEKKEKKRERDFTLGRREHASLVKNLEEAIKKLSLSFVRLVNMNV